MRDTCTITARTLRAHVLDHNWVANKIAEALDTSTFRNSYLCDCILSKYADPSPDGKRQRHRSAIAKFLRTDRRNKVTSKRLLSNPEIVPGLSASALKLMMQRELALLLPDVTVDTFMLPSFSSGASTSKPKVEATVDKKFGCKGDVTPSAHYLASIVTEANPALRRIMISHNFETGSAFRIVPGNVMFTVPKNDDIDRAACKEPDFNMCLQKSCGDVIRRSLRSVGVDLNDQRVNQRLAQQGSLDISLATLDLSAASDSITTELVFQVLPYRWFRALDSIRSRRSFINGKWRNNLALFSTMGNGFTFELESALFWATSKAVAKHLGVPLHAGSNFGIYGDDIIVPSEMYGALTSALAYLGFQPNHEKSFSDGPFRESCGGHFYNGADVTPFYIREPIDSLPRVIWLLNRIRNWSGLSGIAVELEDLYFEIYEKFPLLEKVRGPVNCDSTIAVAWPHLRQATGKLHNVGRSVRCHPAGAYAAQLAEQTGSGVRFNYRNGRVRAAVRDGVSYSRRSFKTGRWEIRQWDDFQSKGSVVPPLEGYREETLSMKVCRTMEDIPVFIRELEIDQP